MPRNESRASGKRPIRSLTPQEKIDAINRVHNGESKAAVARDIGVPESTLRGWCKAEEKIRTQLANMRASGNYEHVLTTSSSDNSDNSLPGSSSRSTPTGQNTTLGLSTPAEKPNEEPEPAPKRIKTDNLTPAVANMSTSARASTLASDVITQLHFYNMLSSLDSKMQAQTMAFLNSYKDSSLAFSGYSAPAASILTDSLQMHRSNGAMANMTLTNMPVNNALLTNGNKRKYTLGYSSATDIPRSSRRQSSQSPNAEKPAGNISQLTTNNRTSPHQPIPSTSADNNMWPSKSNDKNYPLYNGGEKLNAIVNQLQQQPQVSNLEEIISNNAINNNNNNVDHVDHETTNQNSPNNPPGPAKIMADFAKCVDWLQQNGSAICTFNQVNQLKVVLGNLTDWVNGKKSNIMSPKKTNDTS